MKIGIVTLYNELNCGAYLQAYALKMKLDEMGYDVRFVKNKSCDFTFNAIKGGIKEKPYLIFYNLIRLLRYIKDQRVFKTCNTNTKLDVAIIGSDELWNVSNKGFQKSQLYWGKNINASKIISYAVSCNNTTAQEMIEYDRISGRDLFEKFDLISVRDEHTKNVISTVTTKNVSVEPDPTFLLNKYPINSRPISYQYILLYAYEKSYSEDVILSIKQFAKLHNMRLISYNFYYDWCDMNVIGSPLKFPTYVYYAEYVITSTFHGSIFSILLNKQFISTNKENIKIKELLNQFNLKSRHTDCVSVLGQEIDYSSVNELISDNRKKAEDYLSVALCRER